MGYNKDVPQSHFLYEGDMKEGKDEDLDPFFPPASFYKRRIFPPGKHKCSH